MTVFIRTVLLMILGLVSACANQTPPPPAPISTEQFAMFQLADVTVDTSEANISWPQAEREFAASKGITQTSSSAVFGDKDDRGRTSDEDRAAFVAYENVIQSEEAKANYRQRVAAAIEPRLTQALAPAFTGETPLNLTVRLKEFVIRSSAAVALGGDEGISGSLEFAEIGGNESIATSPDLAYLSKNDAVVPATGGLAGLAISIVASAAINVVSDAAVDSSDHLATNYAQSARSWLQLEPYTFNE